MLRRTICYSSQSMCRLFGCRSRALGAVSHELFHGANALRVQSREHPDGWGLGFHDERGEPHVVRSLTPAHGDAEFERVSQYVNARSIVAHVRKASIGRVAIENTHPFQRGPWLFAHNGTLPQWEAIRPSLEAQIDPALRAEIRGQTDSERCFLLFLTLLRGRRDLFAAEDALRVAVRRVRAAAAAAADPASTTFLVTDGKLMLACRVGRTLFISSPAPDRAGRCEYVAVASEDPGEPPPGGKRAWRLLPENALVAVDEDVRLRVTSL